MYIHTYKYIHTKLVCSRGREVFDYNWPTFVAGSLVGHKNCNPMFSLIPSVKGLGTHLMGCFCFPPSNVLHFPQKV